MAHIVFHGGSKAMVDAAHHQCEEEENNHSTDVDEDEAAEVDIEEANCDTQVNRINELIESNTICDKEHGPHDVAKTMEGWLNGTLILNPKVVSKLLKIIQNDTNYSYATLQEMLFPCPSFNDWLRTSNATQSIVSVLK